MGHLNVTLPQVSAEQRDALVKNLTETVVNVLELPCDAGRRVSIRLDFYQPQEMARDGRMLDLHEHPLSHIDVYIPDLPYEQKRELARHLTTALCDTLQFTPQQREDAFVTFQIFRPENIATGGRLLAELALV